MQRPNAAQYAYGSAVVVLATAALLLLTGATGPPGVAAACVAGLLLGVLVAVTMPAGTRPVKTSGATAPQSGNEAVRVPAAQVGAGADTRTGP
ncbi:hypothetical protein SNE510_00730 [Streptomyces sp. NE5-10]|uniref:hypothetical protein n=1 Tax=Streptomyces sp. NE5-10 TaxID=2759674 RepID=UPI0019060D81|nr:hypothetical protein [Streptomyces sp. NE5-10]GHJ90554.1 hypothetical protein SNE510_00730 [Streptomyces sp. NE5-10]